MPGKATGGVELRLNGTRCVKREASCLRAANVFGTCRSQQARAQRVTQNAPSHKRQALTLGRDERGRQTTCRSRETSESGPWWCAEGARSQPFHLLVRRAREALRPEVMRGKGEALALLAGWLRRKNNERDARSRAEVLWVSGRHGCSGCLRKPARAANARMTAMPKPHSRDHLPSTQRISR